MKALFFSVLTFVLLLVWIGLRRVHVNEIVVIPNGPILGVSPK